MPLERLVNELRELGAAGFQKRYATPVLLLTSDVSRDGEAEFHTAFMSPRKLAAGAPGQDLDEAPDRVLKIVKRPGGPFEDRIGLGRARNADVFVPLRHLSKYHAYFTWSADGTRYFLADAGSKNGTKIDGRALPPREPAPLAEGETVQLGPYDFVFHTPSGLLAAVTRRAA